jgi:uncharacterized phage protein (TIGR01671 family)
VREIKFRGKRLDNGEWVYGYYYFNGQHWILTPHPGEKFCHADEIVLETVCQYTGLKDKNGKEIYEGDIVTYPDGDGGYEYCDETISSGVVTWGDESALFYITNNYSAEFPDIWDRVDEMEIIGNIHDTPKGE